MSESPLPPPTPPRSQAEDETPPISREPHGPSSDVQPEQAASEPAVAPVRTARTTRPRRDERGGRWRRGFGRARRQALAWVYERPLTFTTLVVPLLLLSIVTFTRSGYTNYIFDEQEALLANPYVNGDTLRFWQVFERDFWGLPPERTIGSYRPLPNIIWRLTFAIKQHPWLPHWVNVLLHAVNGALLALLAHRWSASRRVAWLAGVAFVLAAVLTEAVCGVVGLADVLAGTFTLLGLHALSVNLLWLAPLSALWLFLGLLAKESAIATLPLLAWAALVLSPLLHPTQTRRHLRASLVALGALAGLVGYTYLRRHFFPVTLPQDYQAPLGAGEPLPARLMHEFLRWFQQPRLPADPINNPLADATMPERVAGALRVYFRGLLQLLFPWQLSGDYSYPQEPVPRRLWTFESVMGGLLMVVPPLIGVFTWLRGTWLEYRQRFRFKYQGHEPAEAAVGGPGASPSVWSRRVHNHALLAFASVWVPLSYFPHSNIPLILPTVRAERFWYLPALGATLLIGWTFDAWLRRSRARYRSTIVGCIAVFFAFQAVRARAHAFDYTNDLRFWRATVEAVPNSAKAHLNYGVMLGARGDLEGRLVENGVALKLAPKWPMANVYYGDTLCRMHRVDEAVPYYLEGFELGPNQQALVALALQCIWDEQAFERHETALREVADRHPGSWVAYLVNDMVKNGKQHDGVDPKYRPRGYDGGPRQE